MSWVQIPSPTPHLSLKTGVPLRVRKKVRKKPLSSRFPYLPHRLGPSSQQLLQLRRRCCLHLVHGCYRHRIHRFRVMFLGHSHIGMAEDCLPGLGIGTQFALKATEFAMSICARHISLRPATSSNCTPLWAVPTAASRPSRLSRTESTSRQAATLTRRCTEMRSLPFSYFCTCWELTSRCSAIAPWVLPAALQATRRLLPSSR